MKKLFQKIPEQVARLLIVFVLIVGGAIGVRSVLPPELKDHAIHIQKTLDRETAKPIHHAGTEACAECHEQNKLKSNGYHKNLSCETCHGASQNHLENPTDIKPTIPKKREFCTRCHTYDPSRPTGFPQINPVVHNPLKQCISCHNPHDPKPPTTPKECDACHAEIARTKAISRHVLLECTTCHDVPNEHRINPRVIKASIQSNRSFCGKCHDENSQVKDVTKVDMTTHGEKYLCWQCHYPHMPEMD
jgi:hypothetical protein